MNKAEHLDKYYCIPVYYLGSDYGTSNVFNQSVHV